MFRLFIRFNWVKIKLWPSLSATLDYLISKLVLTKETELNDGDLDSYYSVNIERYYPDELRIDRLVI